MIGNRRGWAAYGLSWALAGCAVEAGAPVGVARQAIGASGVVVNECATGSAGWIELYNSGTATVDLVNDPALCWFVDDVASGAAPKRVTDTLVTHPPTSTTCASAGRPSSCGLVAPGEIVTVTYGSINAASADACRLVSSAKSGTTCGTTYTDSSSGGPTASTVAGQCFGRATDGGAWSSTARACTRGASNGPACAVGAACDDGNVCTTGETLQADCTCGGGTAKLCADGSACITSCDGPPAGATDAVIAKLARLDRLVLKGLVVTEDTFFSGEVLVEGDTITCVATSCASAPGATDASVIDTRGIILPGLIDTHNHVLFDIFDETDWSPTKSYANHNQWPSDPRYQAMVDAKQYLNGESTGSPVSLGCEMDKYGELKALIAGTTSVAGAANPANKACYGSLARTIDQSPNGLAGDKIQVATLFPSTSTADAACKNIASGKTSAYVIHLGEGVDTTALGEYNKLFTTPTSDGCLHASQTTVIHGTAFGAPELSEMGIRGMSLVWSPRSNVFLYGAGLDLGKTTNVPLAISYGINVAVAPDWSIGGSQNMLDELRFANRVDGATFGGTIGAKALFKMATINAARALKLEAQLGSISVGKKADLFVIGGDVGKPYDALLASTPREVRLVMVGGVALVGDSALRPIAAYSAAPGCDTLDACGASKFLCVAKPGGTTTDKLGQSYAQIEGTLGVELKKYDDLNLTTYDFAPLAPLLKCP